MNIPTALRVALVLILAVAQCQAFEATTAEKERAANLARDVTIHRDAWGVAHILAKTDQSALFGMGYVQAEDDFWQLEDNLIRGTGRASELYGDKELRSDLRTHTFEIPRRSQEDIAKLTQKHRDGVHAYVDGIHHFLRLHPNVKPRLLSRIEPWHILAADRYFFLDFCYGRLHIGGPSASQFEQQVRAAVGSNGWAIAPHKTKSKSAMLFINPHNPFYGWRQFYEVHLQSDEGLNFSGACFFGNPIPTIGHNERLGWTYTVNDVDNSDAFRVVFDDPKNPNKYRYDGDYRAADEWNTTIRVLDDDQLVDRKFTFRKTHHGPLLKRENETTWLAGRVGRLFDMSRIEQAWEMIRAHNFKQWKAAAGRCAIPLFNIVYADHEGNILYVYGGSVADRDPQFNWTRPVDGSDPRTEWKGYLKFSQLPQVENPKAGFVQNCNSSPYVTSDTNNPQAADFPPYILEDRNRDNRRAFMSRKLLREAKDVTLEGFQELAYDTRMYWPMTELEKYARDFGRLLEQDAKKAAKIKPLLDHLLDWDCRATVKSTQASLCVEWYEELYGFGYPAETIKSEYRDNRLTHFDALKKAASRLETMHGDWKIPWGEVHRMQRVRKKGTIRDAAFSLSRFKESIPCPGGPGPLGIAFTVYSTPSIQLIRPKRYALVGTCYMSVVEFGDRVRAASIVPFGASADDRSPHYFDQAKLYTNRQLKPAWFYPEEVRENAVLSYHPGDEVKYNK